MSKHRYSRVRAIKCSLFDHAWMAYDFGVDKCLVCNKERQDSRSSLPSLSSLRSLRLNDDAIEETGGE